MEAVWQGCNEAVGVCHPPINRDFTLAVSGSRAAAPVAAVSAPAARAEAANDEV